MQKTFLCGLSLFISISFHFFKYFSQGKPRPKITWLKDNEVVNPTQVNIRNSDCDSIIFIRKADRKHSGKYKMTVQVENLVDTAILDIQIVG